MTARIFHNHALWEDYQHGMYALRYAPEDDGARDAAELLGDPDACEAAMDAVVREWRYAADQNLSHTARNRRAWLGQATCTFALGVPEYVTKMGWHLLSTEQQDTANGIADRVIRQWEGGNAETLFGI